MKRQQKKNLRLIEENIESSLIETDPSNPQFKELVSNYKEIIATQKELAKERFHVSGDTIITALVNIAGILLVINAEDTRAITSKAFQLIKKN